MSKLTYGIFLGSILGLFLSIVVYFFAPDFEFHEYIFKIL